MPMIELTLTNGALDEATQAALVERLTSAVSRWEGMAESPRVRSTIWAFVDQRADGDFYVGGARPERHHFRVRITVAEGSLDAERKEGLVGEVTSLVLKAEGAPNDPREAARVWCHVIELADGGWGAAGR